MRDLGSVITAPLARTMQKDQQWILLAAPRPVISRSKQQVRQCLTARLSIGSGLEFAIVRRCGNILSRASHNSKNRQRDKRKEANSQGLSPVGYGDELQFSENSPPHGPILPSSAGVRSGQAPRTKFARESGDVPSSPLRFLASGQGASAGRHGSLVSLVGEASAAILGTGEGYMGERSLATVPVRVEVPAVANRLGYMGEHSLATVPSGLIWRRQPLGWQTPPPRVE